MMGWAAYQALCRPKFLLQGWGRPYLPDKVLTSRNMFAPLCMDPILQLKLQTQRQLPSLPPCLNCLHRCSHADM